MCRFVHEPPPLLFSWLLNNKFRIDNNVCVYMLWDMQQFFVCETYKFTQIAGSERDIITISKTSSLLHAFCNSIVGSAAHKRTYIVFAFV